MKTFLLKSLIFVAIFFILDKAFLVIRHITPDFDYDQRIRQVLDGDIRKDLLVIGSSRGTADIVSWMFEDSLMLSSFNLSYGGSEVELQKFILEQVINHQEAPKYLIKIIDDDFELHHHDANSFRADRLYSLVRYEEVRQELIHQGELNPLFSKLFILSQLKKPVFKFSKPAPLNDTLIKYGNLPPIGQRENQDWYVENVYTYDIDKEVEAKKAAFIHFQNLCLENNIVLILTIPPSYRAINPAFAQRIQDLTLPGVHFYTYDTSNVAYTDNANFQDRHHLNQLGATTFTNELVQYLKTVMDADAPKSTDHLTWNTAKAD